MYFRFLAIVASLCFSSIGCGDADKEIESSESSTHDGEGSDTNAADSAESMGSHSDKTETGSNASHSSNSAGDGESSVDEMSDSEDSESVSGSDTGEDSVDSDTSDSVEETGEDETDPDPDPMGCGEDWMPSDVEVSLNRRVVRRSIEVASKEREYLVSVPDEYDPNKEHALVFGFHGSGGDREQLRRYMNVENPAGNEAIMIYPSGLAKDGGSTAWDLNAGSDDLKFVDALFKKYRMELCIDAGRVFATGHSFGGCMSNAVGCFRGDLFRAIAPVAGCGPFSGQNNCVGQVATLMIHSPKDTATSYKGAIRGCSRWLRASSCDEMPDCGCHWVDTLEEPDNECVQEAQEPYPTDVSIEVTDRDEKPPELRAYIGCKEGYPVAFADHWRRERSDGDEDKERWHNPPPWSAPLIWEFFSKLASPL